MAKLGLTVVATIILLAHTQPIGQVAAVAGERLLSGSDLHDLRIQLIADAGAALMALLLATTLSVYKPWGLTSYGRRNVRTAPRVDVRSKTSTSWRSLWVIGVVIVVAVFAWLHLTGGGLHGN